MKKYFKFLLFAFIICSGQSLFAQCENVTAFDMTIARSECTGEPGTSTITVTVTYSKILGGGLCLGWRYNINGVGTTIDPELLTEDIGTDISISHTITDVPCDATFSARAAVFPSATCGNSNTSEACLDARATASSPPSLPVKLSFFRSSIVDNKVVLNWRTESEVNNEMFEIQRSTDNGRFTTLDMMPGQGSTNEAHDYRYIDQSPYVGSSFYRLKQIDYDGAFEYSPTIEVRNSTNHSGVKLSPNPLSLGTGRLLIVESDAEYPAQILITDMNGREVFRSNKNLASGINAMNLPSNTIPGIYLVSIQYGVTTVTEKMVVID